MTLRDTKRGRYSVNAAAALVYGLDSNVTYNIVKGSERKVRGRWYVEVVDPGTNLHRCNVARSILFDRWEHARKMKEAERARQEQERRERERRTVYIYGEGYTLEWLRAAAERGELFNAETVRVLVRYVEELLDEADNCEC